MTNSQIILTHSIELMKQGKIKGTGHMMEYVIEDGSRIQVEEPEALHTFAAWKQMGYSVKKGEKAVAQITIWKHTTKMLPTDTESADMNKMNQQINDQGGQSKMFMKVASFFTASQVQPIAVN